MFRIRGDDVFGLLKPLTDVHTLGLLSFARVLVGFGFRAELGDEGVSADLEALGGGGRAPRLEAWIRNARISCLGFSYRLDPDDGVRIFTSLMAFLAERGLLAARGGPVRAVFYAGLPEGCEKVKERYPGLDAVFRGDESGPELLLSLGLSAEDLPGGGASELGYDLALLRFGEDLVRREDYLAEKPVDRGSSPRFGLRGEKVVERIAHGRANGLPPLLRAHAGPYLPDRKEAVALFREWASSLAKGGMLDILSIGTSQLSQSRFGESWEGSLDGGGVPIASPEEYASIWRAARPMLVRTYAGTARVGELARMYERTIDIAWHALSFWWFCALDGRGRNTVLTNLEEHFDAIRWIAGSGKPLEPNVPHHFAFRGADDLSYVVSGYVAAAAAKRLGIRHLMLQTMLNTPKQTWGVQDLAKARALLRLVRGLEGPDFSVYLQPRAGLAFFSPDPLKAKAQLAAATALMDDIEPGDASSPAVVHVVSYSEGSGLADPPVIEESLRIARRALSEYRARKKEGTPGWAGWMEAAAEREKRLYGEAKRLIGAAERLIPDPYSPRGMYAMLACGMFPLPYLDYCREEFAAAAIPTALIEGGVGAVGRNGGLLSVQERIEAMEESLAKRGPAGAPGGGGRHD